MKNLIKNGYKFKSNSLKNGIKKVVKIACFQQKNTLRKLYKKMYLFLAHGTFCSMCFLGGDILCE